MRRTAAAGERAAFSPPVFLCDLGPLSFSPAIVNWVPGARSLGQACISELTVEGMRDRDMALEGGDRVADGGVRLETAVEVTFLYKFQHKEGSRLVSTLTSEHHGDQLSAFAPSTSS